MKTIIEYYLFLFFTINYAQKNDTIFLKNSENRVYIINKKSNSFSVLIDKYYSFNNQNENWVLIKKYKNDYINYLPCDLGYLNKISISKNEIYFKGVEDFTICVKKLKKTSNTVTYTGTIKETKIKIKLELKLIDSQNQIAIFRITNLNTKTIDYMLMINNSFIKNFDILVNECITEKVREFEFDNLDLEKMFYQLDN